MRSESNKMNQPNENLINFERTWKNVICLNPAHDTLSFRTNREGDIKCTICQNLMVTEVPMKNFVLYRDIDNK